MSRYALVCIAAWLLLCNCGNEESGVPGNGGDSAHAGLPDTTGDKYGHVMLPNEGPPDGPYICGFTASHPYATLHGVAGSDAGDEAVIERTFKRMWHDVIGGRESVINVEKDADEDHAAYRYAAAMPSYTATGDEKRMIYYKPHDLAPLIGQANGWFLRSIALHELGHHINGDPFTNITRDTAELGADDFAGFVMGGRMHTTLDTALLAFSTLTDINPTNGYPTREQRMAAVRAGWERSQLSPLNSLVYAFVTVRGNRSGIFYNDRDADLRDIENAAGKNSMEAIIKKDTASSGLWKMTTEASASPGDFYLDSSFLYFITPDTMTIVGKVARSNRPEHSLMVYDKYYQYMYLAPTRQRGLDALITYIPDKARPETDQRITIGYVHKK